MSEVTKEYYADVTHYYCPICSQACAWTKSAKRATFDENITSLTYDHFCGCADNVIDPEDGEEKLSPKIHDLDKIYPIVKIGKEVSKIILAS